MRERFAKSVRATADRLFISPSMCLRLHTLIQRHAHISRDAVS